MLHSFIQGYVHAVFSTKGRRKIISKEIRPQLWADMADFCRKQGMKFKFEILNFKSEFYLDFDPADFFNGNQPC